MAAGKGVPQLSYYIYEFVDEVPDKLKCSIFLYPLKDPIQVTECGHRLCKLCVDPILGEFVVFVDRGPDLESLIQPSGNLVRFAASAFVD